MRTRTGVRIREARARREQPPRRDDDDDGLVELASPMRLERGVRLHVARTLDAVLRDTSPGRVRAQQRQKGRMGQRRLCRGGRPRLGRGEGGGRSGERPAESVWGGVGGVGRSRRSRPSTSQPPEPPLAARGPPWRGRGRTYVLAETGLVLEDLLGLELGPGLGREVKLLDEVEVARADAGARGPVDVALGFVDAGGGGKRGRWGGADGFRGFSCWTEVRWGSEPRSTGLGLGCGRERAPGGSRGEGGAAG